MKVINHVYNKSLNLIDVVADAMGGRIVGNYIKGNNKWYVGTHYLSTLESGLSGMLVDTTYKEDVSLECRVGEENTVGLYFYITDKDVRFRLNDKQKLVGELSYNLSIIDVSIPNEYIIEKGTGFYCICVFIDKKLLKEYLKKMNPDDSDIETIFDSQHNTIICMDRMSNKSFNLISDFQKIQYDNPLYDFFFKGMIYELISNYLVGLNIKKINTSKVIDYDIKSVIATELMLTNMVEESFPGIDFLANEVSMSGTKYKNLFTQMAGLSPGAFFANNKLHRSKQLLTSGEFTINEIADKLKYYNVSYFAKCFKEKFGIYPKEYQSLF